jgi:hypothetical protein
MKYICPNFIFCGPAFNGSIICNGDEMMMISNMTSQVTRKPDEMFVQIVQVSATQIGAMQPEQWHVDITFQPVIKAPAGSELLGHYTEVLFPLLFNKVELSENVT